MTKCELLSTSIRTPQEHSRAIGFCSLLGGCLSAAIVAVACGGIGPSANAITDGVAGSASDSSSTGGAKSTIGGAQALGATDGTKTNSGGAASTGAKKATGDTASMATGGTASTSGRVARPSYNTGNGFFVVNGKLYDPSGNEFHVRGINKLHWDAASPGFPKTHANTERWVIDFSQPTSTNLALMQQSIDAGIVPMPGNWDGTCDENTSTLTTIVDSWVAQAGAWKSIDRYMILNIANEWGPAGTVWRDSYITAIGRLRAAGYLSTISVTSGGCGQDNADLALYAAAVFNSDPQKNVIFDQHIYGMWANGAGQSWQTDLITGLNSLAAVNLPMIVGEFGPGRNLGPSPTPMTPGEIIQACDTRGIGWLAWAWDAPAYNATDTDFALSLTGDYRASADLSTYGKDVVENPTYGLLARATPATF